MSATGRSDVRHSLDHYETPPSAVHAILPWFLAEMYPGGGRILDPGCGGGGIGAVLAARMRHPIIGVELDQARADEAVSRWSTAHRNSPVYEQVIVGDFLELHDGLEVCATIGNPPFSHAQEFVDHARSTFKGPVCFLLRVSFLESKKRAAWWRANPANVYVLSQRPSFCWTYTCEADADHPRRSVPVCFKGELRCAECEAPMRLSSTSDSAAYGWFIWGDGPRGRLEVLPC